MKSLITYINESRTSWMGDVIDNIRPELEAFLKKIKNPNTEDGDTFKSESEDFSITMWLEKDGGKLKLNFDDDPIHITGAEEYGKHCDSKTWKEFEDLVTKTIEDILETL